MELAPGRLPGAFPELLREGQMYTALVLSTVFSEKYKGQRMQPGEAAEVQLPVALANSSPRRVSTLLARAGHYEAVPFIWLGDTSVGDATLYVAFSPLRKKRQFWKLLSSGTSLVEDRVVRQNGGSEVFVETLRISSYIKDKLDNLWSEKYGFGQQLSKAAAAHPGHRICFSGISHGAALAQAAALRFILLEPAACHRVTVTTWNGYKWTDAMGSALVGRLLGERLLPCVLSRGAPRRWDSAAEFPPSTSGFAPMPGVVLLDVDSGVFLERVRLGDAQLSMDFASRMAELHFAKTAIRALRTAMVRAMQGHGDKARRHWQVARWTLAAQHRLGLTVNGRTEDSDTVGDAHLDASFTELMGEGEEEEEDIESSKPSA
mmetsp:Transcript_20507/g.43607  ORF Transcript_20507/g.43607 Transcript_20507/m.43607 type:complete len:376 (-) Transcript_20507:57-1184(-)